ncbi:aldehyde dehydrogenase (NADP(+)) [Flavobacteriaceae bacterium TP-CH-4]|uniref:Aldehyde dehydrogenase (NADP(+)) n=1 Tax=Pelagihabitans pacificus TaxID=2696054 RepID=A0A967B187_9FLAO|nr:aldehyde dehydrogenase (NADP(+)) [Pelagihabitans pacificus]NHF60236.1 aldehyde dehydrogenase (NADP(+)) [Pelagihabitans pacificus]
MLTGKNYIGFDLSAEGDTTYRTFNPLLNVENPTIFSEASEEEVDMTVTLAAKAFDAYRAISGVQKADFINAIADEIMALDDELVNMYCAETGLPEGRAKGERGRTVGQLRSFADLVRDGSWVEATIDTGIPDRTPLPKPDLRKILVPLGPVVVFGASNFPLAFSTAGGDTAAALAAGCPVIVKSHPMHAGTGELVASAIIKAAKKTGMPNGVFSNLNSSGIEVGVQLVKHPKVKAVGFTGSIGGGRALFDLAAQREEPIPVFAEMGSVNPVIALPSALSEKGNEWAKNYAGSITLAAGQFCTNPGLIFGLRSAFLDGFIKSLGEEIERLDPNCMLHPNIHDKYERGKSELSSQAGVTIAASVESGVAPNYATQRILTVDGDEFLKNPTLHKEVFGPFSVVVRCKDEMELTTIISNLEGQLTGTILGSSEEIYKYSGVVEALHGRVGRLIFNGVPTGVEVCPAMQHGGPYPASTDSRFTAVGVHSIKRWVRPLSYQNWPDIALPDELKNNNPLKISRLVDNKFTQDAW